MLDYIKSYLSSFGLAGLLLGVFIEATGVPFPGGVMVVIAGFLVNEGRLNFGSALAVVLAGYTAGSLLAYTAGRCIGLPFLMRCGKLLRVSPAKLERTRSLLFYSAPAFIVAGRFFPGLGNLTPYMAGVSRIGPAVFLFYNTIFAAGWATLYLLLGMFFGYNYHAVAGRVNNGLVIFGLCMLAFWAAGKYFLALWRKRVKTKGVS